MAGDELKLAEIEERPQLEDSPAAVVAPAAGAGAEAADASTGMPTIE